MAKLGLKPTIRALTFFTGNASSVFELRKELEHAIEILQLAESRLSELGYKVFTKRVSFPGLSAHLAFKLLDMLEKGVLASTGYSRDLSLNDVAELASQGIYVPILHRSEPSIDHAKKYSEIIHSASKRSYVAATRISVGFHQEDFVTPYYPDSSSPGRRFIGLALLYPDLLLELLKQGLELEESVKLVLESVEPIIRLLKSLTGLEVYVDYSLSPWMESSVAGIYEVLGYSVLSPGAAYLTWLVNKYITEYSNPDARVGFNEVMLPYAEDSLLMKYGAQGLLKARDFLVYASTCVAGVDMIVVHEDVHTLAKLIASTMALARVKNRPLPFRAIPGSENPGEVAYIERFGHVPVLNY